MMNANLGSFARMRRIQTLRDQAELLRRLAANFDMPTIKADLMRLAERCDALADGLARELAQRPNVFS